MLNTIVPRLVEPVRWLLIVGIAVTLAQTVLFFVSGPQSGRSAVRSAPATQAPQRQATSINAILARNLFGVPDQTTLETRAAPAVETRLPLELRGVFVGETEADSAAIVAQKGKTGELYGIGDVLPGNAELVEVAPDHIVLRRAGNLETLNFPQFNDPGLLASYEAPTELVEEIYDEGNGPPEQWTDDSQPTDQSRDDSSGPGPGETGAVTPRQLIDSYRERLDQDPEGALSQLGIAPVAEGSANGYRLGNLANSPYLSQTGLQPGDVVLSVNGTPVGNIQQDRSQIESVLAQGSARLEVQRGTRRFFVTASLK